MSDFPVVEWILISVACAFIFALVVKRFHVLDVVGWPAGYFTAVYKAVGGMTMKEPVMLCRYDEQDEIEKNITWLGEHINEKVSEDILKHDGERAALYTILKGMYTVFCHKNGLFNKLEG